MTTPSGTAETKWATLPSKLFSFPSSRENRTREKWLRSTDPHLSVLACVATSSFSSHLSVPHNSVCSPLTAAAPPRTTIDIDTCNAALRRHPPSLPSATNTH
ncbi:hypothetical protein PIB30_027791 [Stylosanthes scabra]|uniref:Uncharacterized protein n=1 Tax=Stylosanthes scabra TaxID=79078 RepID=A0ABU6RB05_9FABA|nr:hypothetical protein [Stylosanthes scabra]